jgi:hypothetical protein
MSNTELKILFPTEKLDALRFFMGKKELTVEQELTDTLDKTYEKVVPAHVREYVESRIEQAPVQEQAPEPEAQAQQPEPQRTSRQTRRQREQAAASAAPVLDVPPENTAPEEEETQNQGMTMSM